MALTSSLDLWPPTFSTTVFGLIAVFVALHYASSRKVHPSEPTVLPSWIPFAGHLIGMAVQGGRYIKRIGLSHPNEPIFTLPVPGSRLYIVTDPVLAAAVQRNSKTLSFTPLVPDITKRILGLDNDTVELVRQNLDPEPGDPRGFLADMHDLVYGSLGPGSYLNELSRAASQEFCSEVRDAVSTVRRIGSSTMTVDLLQWIRHFVAAGSANYLFGAENPFAQDPGLEHAFWDFDQGLGGLMMGIAPSITAAKAYRGREKLVAALVEYLEAERYKAATGLIQDRLRIEKKYGMSSEMAARSGLSFLFAAIVNATTTSFWAVLRLFADADLLLKVRKEIEETLSRGVGPEGAATISISTAKENCVTLVAVIRESMRIGSENFSVRLVKSDTLLADRYFLKKGSVVQIAGGVIHADKSIWGEDALEFNPHRVVTQKEKGSSIHPAAFRGFGGGKTLCPGRHFAMNEMLMLVIMIVLAFDVTGANGDQLRVPPKNDGVMPVHILEPRSDQCPTAVIRVREGAEVLDRLEVVD